MYLMKTNIDYQDRLEKAFKTEQSIEKIKERIVLCATHKLHQLLDIQNNNEK